MEQAKCPNCGADFKVLKNILFTTCSYCGYTFNLKTLQEWVHYFFPIYINYNSAWIKLRSFISRRYGVPYDFNESSYIKNVMLHYIPLHVFHVEAEATCQSDIGKAVYHKILDIAIPAYSGFWFDSILNSHKFSIRGKIFFKPALLEKGKYYPPNIQSDYAKNLAQNIASSLIMKEANESCKGYSQISKMDVKYIGLIHYPIWEIYYNYHNEIYKNLIDGTNGKVMFVEYPLSREARSFLLFSSLFLILFCSLGGLIIGSLIISSILGLILGLISSIIVSSPLLSTAFSLKIRGYEEISKKDSILSSEEIINLFKELSIFKTRTPIVFDI